MKIKTGISILAAWFLFLFFAGVTAFALLSRQYILVPGLLAVAGLGFFILFYFGSVEIDERGIRQTSLSGKYEILWADVRQIETRVAFHTLVFRGDDKVLTILGPGCWSDSEETAEFVFTLADAKGIPLVEGGRSFRFPRNTKIQM